MAKPIIIARGGIDLAQKDFNTIVFKKARQLGCRARHSQNDALAA